MGCELLERELIELRAIAASRARELQTVFDLLPEPAWSARPDGAVEYCNRRWYEYTGTTFETMHGRGWTEVHDPRAPPEVLARWQESLATGRPFEMDVALRGRDGTFAWFHSRVEPVRDAAGAIVRWVGINVDLDDRRHVEGRVAPPYELLVQSVSQYAMVLLDPDGRITSWNPGATAIIGYEPEEIIGAHVSRFYPPEDVAAGKPTSQLEIAARTGSYQEEGWRVRKNGSRFWASVVVTAATGEDAVLQGFATITRDESAKKKLADEEHDRRRIEEERDHLFALTTDLIGVAGFDGHFRRVNPAWTTTLGWTAEEVTASPWLHFVHPDDVERTIAAAQTLFSGANVSYFQNRYRTKDGAYRWLDWAAVPFVTQELIYCIARDVTDAKAAEEARATLEKRLIVADRMVSVGTLASGVAHEINNPLSYVMANLGLVLDEIRALSGGSTSGRMKELEELALLALEGAERVRKIVRGLKTFSRVDQELRVVMELAPTLELAINMSFNEIRHRARLVKDYGTTPLVEADDARLGQVFVNLLVNAAQAIPAGNAERNEIRISTFTGPQGQAVIEIRDTGPGIPEELRARIFEPFFTTKGVGVGTGLGLSICHNIITGMGGEISVVSEPGHGAAFRVALPPAKVQQLAGDATLVPVPGAGRRGVILVVDDEPVIGMALKRILRDHEVTVTSTVTEALEHVAAGKHFDVIFSDLMMPQMSGEDFYRELTRRAPDAAARVVFITGGAFTSAATAFLDEVGNERLEKPFSASLVRDLVKRLLPADVATDPPPAPPH